MRNRGFFLGELILYLGIVAMVMPLAYRLIQSTFGLYSKFTERRLCQQELSHLSEFFYEDILTLQTTLPLGTTPEEFSFIDSQNRVVTYTKVGSKIGKRMTMFYPLTSVCKIESFSVQWLNTKLVQLKINTKEETRLVTLPLP